MHLASFVACSPPFTIVCKQEYKQSFFPFSKLSNAQETKGMSAHKLGEFTVGPEEVKVMDSLVSFDSRKDNVGSMLEK